MLNRRRQIAGLFNSGSWLRAQTGRALFGLVPAAIAPRVAEAARKGERRADNQDRKNDDDTNQRDTSEENNQSKTASDQGNDEKASAEARDSGAKSDSSGKHVRNESTDENHGGRGQEATAGGKSRGDSGRNSSSDSDSSNTSTEDNGSHHGGRHVQGFEQKADKAATDAPSGNSPSNNEPDTTTVTPANPNVVMDHVPDTSINDLIVQGNDHVIANVSSSGGFAFARSGDVIAVSGPDGASIVQASDVTTGTSGTTPSEPSDGGGNNDVVFSS